MFTPEKRRWIMSRVKGSNTRPELLVRSLAHRLGFRFRVNRRDLPGCPDIVFPKLKKVVLVNGCFWHSHEGCARSSIPSTNREFWTNKLAKNVQRDKRNLEELRKTGWEVLVIWNCETRDLARVNEVLRHFLME